MVGAPVRGGVGQPHGALRPAILGRDLHALDVHGVLLRPRPDGLGRPPHSVRQKVAEPLPVGDHLQQLQGRSAHRPIPASARPVSLQVEDPFSHSSMAKRDGPPGRDGVQPQVVAQSVGIEDAVQVGDSGCRHPVEFSVSYSTLCRVVPGVVARRGGGRVCRRPRDSHSRPGGGQRRASSASASILSISDKAAHLKVLGGETAQRVHHGGDARRAVGVGLGA